LIAIIDQGIIEAELSVKHKVKHLICDELGYVQSSKTLTSKYKSAWHGTNIANIIGSLTGPLELWSIRLSKNEEITVHQLCSALDYCASQLEIKIINISLGYSGLSSITELRKSCQKCHRAGKIIVASAHLDNKKNSYPAAFSFVFGVGIGALRKRDQFTFLGRKRYINVLAKGGFQRLTGYNGRMAILEGTSYAAASFTGILVGIFKGNKSVTQNQLIGILIKLSTASASLHFSKDTRISDVVPELIGLKRPLLFPTDDERILNLAGNREKGMLMQYPLDPNGEFSPPRNFDVISLPGILSDKIFKHADQLVIGNFLDNKFLLNRVFGFHLMKFFSNNNVEVIPLDSYIAEQAKLDFRNEISIDI